MKTELKHVKLFEGFLNEKTKQSDTNKNIIKKYLNDKTTLNEFSSKDNDNYAGDDYTQSQKYWVNKANKIYLSIGADLTDGDTFLVSLIDINDKEFSEIPLFNKSFNSFKAAEKAFLKFCTDENIIIK